MSVFNPPSHTVTHRLSFLTNWTAMHGHLNTLFLCRSLTTAQDTWLDRNSCSSCHSPPAPSSCHYYSHLNSMWISVWLLKRQDGLVAFTGKCGKIIILFLWSFSFSPQETPSSVFVRLQDFFLMAASNTEWKALKTKKKKIFLQCSNSLPFGYKRMPGCCNPLMSLWC